MIPTSVAALTPAFLTSAIRSQVPGARVTSCRPEPLVGERGIAASLVRLHLSGDGPLPPTVVAKLPPDDPTVRGLLNEMGFLEREVVFYRDLAGSTPLCTPTCYHADVDPVAGRSLLLLEDLAAARNGDSVGGGSVEDVAAVLGALAPMHARRWRDGPVEDAVWSRLPSLLAPAAVPEAFERGWSSFLGKLSIPLDGQIQAVHAWISEVLPVACTALFETGPRTLVHNDVQGDNLFFSPGSGRPVIFIDWQLVTYARCVVDVASAIRQTLEPEVRREAEPSLLRLYHQALVADGAIDYPWDQYVADYELATVLAPARLATAVGLHPGLSRHPGAPWDTLFLRMTAR